VKKPDTWRGAAELCKHTENGQKRSKHGKKMEILTSPHISFIFFLWGYSGGDVDPLCEKRSYFDHGTCEISP
jgi:hypothetical protein